MVINVSDNETAKTHNNMGVGGKLGAMNLCKPFVDEHMVATLANGT